MAEGEECPWGGGNWDAFAMFGMRTFGYFMNLIISYHTQWSVMVIVFIPRIYMRVSLQNCRPNLHNCSWLGLCFRCICVSHFSTSGVRSMSNRTYEMSVVK